MALARIDGVEGNLENDVGLDDVNASRFFDRARLKMFCQFFDLDVCESGVGLSDDAKFIGIFLTNCERVVTENMGAFAVSLLRFYNDNIECGHGFL